MWEDSLLWCSAFYQEIYDKFFWKILQSLPVVVVYSFFHSPDVGVFIPYEKCMWILSDYAQYDH